MHTHFNKFLVLVPQAPSRALITASHNLPLLPFDSTPWRHADPQNPEPTEYPQGRYGFQLAFGMYEGRPESKDRLRISHTQVIQYIFKTWPQVIFTCSQH